MGDVATLLEVVQTARGVHASEGLGESDVVRVRPMPLPPRAAPFHTVAGGRTALAVHLQPRCAALSIRGDVEADRGNVSQVRGGIRRTRLTDNWRDLRDFGAVVRKSISVAFHRGELVELPNQTVDSPHIPPRIIVRQRQADWPRPPAR